METREHAKKTSIDEYVLAESNVVYDVYARYIELLFHPEYPASSVFITKYEDMIKDFNSWLTQLLHYCEFDISPELKETLVNENDQLKPKQENYTKHLRKGQHGDYKNKLNNETIELLNQKFSTILNKFGYEF